MENSAHCMLCENQVIDYYEGSKCGIANESPQFVFSTVCNEIRFEKKRKERIVTVNAKYQGLKKSNLTIYSYSILFFLLGWSIIIGAYYFSGIIWESGYISGIPLVLSGAGILVISVAISTFTKHRTKFNIAKKRKTELDNLLQLYKTDYELSLKFGKHYHGVSDVEADLKIINQNLI